MFGCDHSQDKPSVSVSVLLGGNTEVQDEVESLGPGIARFTDASID